METPAINITEYSTERPLYLAFELGNVHWKLGFTIGQGIENVVVDASSIEVKRRYRRAKTDRLELNKLLTMLIRYHSGEAKVWHVVHGPSVAQEDQRQLHRELLRLKGIGLNTAWLYSMEFFSWRQFRNRREVGALAGLTPTPYQSGSGAREQGIDKSGNRYIRAIAIEIAWRWLYFQPDSTLSQWYQERFGHGSSRIRKIGIVALAGKLLIAL
jgi:transposase